MMNPISAVKMPSANQIPAHLEDNPLVTFRGLAPFGAIRPDHVTPALDFLLACAERDLAELGKITPDEADWENFIAALDDVTEQLGHAWEIVGHLSSVIDTPELRAAHNDNEPRMVEFFTRFGQNETLFACARAMQRRSEAGELDLAPVRRKIIDNMVRGFRLSGAELPADKKARFATVQEKLAALSTRFSENLLDTINAYELILTEAEIAGLPVEVVSAARNAAKEKGQEGYRFTLQAPSMIPLLQFAADGSVRERIYHASATKASELGLKPEWDNTLLMTEILALRKEKSQLLGFDSFADLSVYTKMADSPQQVFDFLTDLATRSRTFAERDYAELKSFAVKELKLQPVQNWDLGYASEKLREKRYAFSENEVKQYFQEPNVLDGLFGIISRLFDVAIKPDQAETWHPDVRFFRIERDGVLVGQFYLDLYARNGKRSGAWMDGERSRLVRGERLQTPVAYLVCNFTPPPDDASGKAKPALLTHDDVITLFHEFGHGLHHLLTRIDESGVAGISGVEWDAVELPSQFMENFCWEWEVISEMTAHVDTGAPLPRELFDKMLKAKNFQSGMQMLRQVELSLVDMQLHCPQKTLAGKSVQEIVDAVRTQVAVIPASPFNRFQHSFSHIFAGGYAAGYYSYKWAEVLSADAYAACEEAAAASGTAPSAAIEAGQRFMREILEVGGSRPAIESFRAFRGREPQIDALLRHSGLDQPLAA